MSDKTNPFLQFMKNPWITPISLAIGILSFVFSIYSSYSVQKDKSLSILVDQDITPIIDTSKVQSKKFSVVDSKNRKINGDISAFKIKIINDGDLSIWKRDVLSPLSIELYEKLTLTSEDADESKMHEISLNILDSFTIESSRSEAIQPKIVRVGSKLAVDFKILESGDEITETIIFIGQGMPDYKIKGVVEGVAYIKNNDDIKSQISIIEILLALFSLVVVGIVIYLLW